MTLTTQRRRYKQDVETGIGKGNRSFNDRYKDRDKNCEYWWKELTEDTNRMYIQTNERE